MALRADATATAAVTPSGVASDTCWDDRRSGAGTSARRRRDARVLVAFRRRRRRRFSRRVSSLYSAAARLLLLLVYHCARARAHTDTHRLHSFTSPRNACRPRVCVCVYKNDCQPFALKKFREIINRKRRRGKTRRTPIIITCTTEQYVCAIVAAGRSRGRYCCHCCGRTQRAAVTARESRGTVGVWPPPSPRPR